MIIREKVVRVRLTEKEYAYLKQIAKADPETRTKSGKENLSSYIRKCILNSSGFQRDTRLSREIKSLTFQIRKIGVNVNQAVKKINSNFYEIETTEKLYEELSEIERLLIETIEKVEKADGNYKANEY